MRPPTDLTDLARWAFAAVAASTVACGDAPPAPDETGTTTATAPLDADQDGFPAAEGDCDDHNNTVFPGARERSFDGVDADCDGEDQPSLGDDRYDEALPTLDDDGDGAVSLAEFEAACAGSAMVFGDANPGVVETHVTCGGTASCRGMILHSWNELYEHDCRGVNTCAGWSCVETADGADRAGETVFREAQCNWCHSGSDGAFLVHIPAGEDPTAWLATFLDRSDAEFRAAIAFGMRGIGADGYAASDMPSHYETLSRAEMDAVIAYLRGLPLEAADSGPSH
jgi:hypothetical protein